MYISKERAGKERMEICANPEQEKLQVKIPEIQSEQAKLEILDINGCSVLMEVIERNCCGKEVLIEIGSLLPGYYYLKLHWGLDSILVSSFVKQ